MPGRRPGALCSTTADKIDDGTSCLYASPVPGPLGSSELASTARAIKFSDLWRNYPNHHPFVDKNGDTPKGYENQCAIKISLALANAGQKLDGFRGATVTVSGYRLAIRAEELASWLRTSAPTKINYHRSLITGENWQNNIKNRTGIIFFQDYWKREGESKPTGDHIDLWNGSRLTASGLEGIVVTALRFGLGINSGPGFSDLGHANRIEFWEIL